MEALAHSELIGLVVKEATQRARPVTNDNVDEGFWQRGSSFPSGHALGAFSVAAVFAKEYREHIAVPILAYSFATLISLSRVSGRDHYLSDIFVGAAGGFLIGRYTYNEHHDTGLPGSPVHRFTQRLRPEIAVGPTGVGLSWKF
jgi:membrane-associated phospholipid phosphatase